MNEPAATIAPAPRALPRAAAHGEIARLLLAFLATAGLFYVNIMPALVDGLVEGAGFSNREAGMVGSSNVYGAALGALVAVFLVRRISWKPVAAGLLCALIALDLLSLLVQQFALLVAMRFGHGFVGGMLVGIGFAIIARTRNPDRTFGYLLVVQFGLGGLGMMLLPPLVPLHGTGVLFAALIAFSLATLAMLPFLDDYPVATDAAPPLPGLRAGRVSPPLLLGLLATFLFQAGNMAVFAYVIGLGEAAGLERVTIGPILALAAWIGIAGSALVIVLSTRFGRALPLAVAIVATAAATWALHFSTVPNLYLVANCVVGVTWSFGIPYLLGMCAAFDRSGQMAALGGFASKMGLASGPLLAALVVGSDDYARVIDIGVLALALSLLAALYPARLLDRGA